MEQSNRSSVVSLASIGPNTVNPRESLHQIRRMSQDSYYETMEIGAERFWRLSYLKVSVCVIKL